MRKKIKWTLIVLAGLIVLNIIDSATSVGNKSNDDKQTIQKVTNQVEQKVVEQKVQVSPTPVPTRASAKQEYPDLDKEIMEKFFIVRCGDGIEGAVFLLDKPTDIAGGARSKARVSCNATGYAFNKFYNKSLSKTFYAVNLDGGGIQDPHYGWIADNFLRFTDK